MTKEEFKESVKEKVDQAESVIKANLPLIGKIALGSGAAIILAVVHKKKKDKVIQRVFDWGRLKGRSELAEELIHDSVESKLNI